MLASRLCIAIIGLVAVAPAVPGARAFADDADTCTRASAPVAERLDAARARSSPGSGKAATSPTPIWAVASPIGRAATTMMRSPTMGGDPPRSRNVMAYTARGGCIWAPETSSALADYNE